MADVHANWPFEGDPIVSGASIIPATGPTVDGVMAWTRLNTTHLGVAAMLMRVFKRSPRALWARALPNGDIAACGFGEAGQPRVLGVVVSRLTADDVNLALERLASVAAA